HGNRLGLSGAEGPRRNHGVARQPPRSPHGPRSHQLSGRIVDRGDRNHASRPLAPAATTYDRTRLELRPLPPHWPRERADPRFLGLISRPSEESGFTIQTKPWNQI